MGYSVNATLSEFLRYSVLETSAFSLHFLGIHVVIVKTNYFRLEWNIKENSRPSLPQNITITRGHKGHISTKPFPEEGYEDLDRHLDL